MALPNRAAARSVRAAGPAAAAAARQRATLSSRQQRAKWELQASSGGSEAGDPAPQPEPAASAGGDASRSPRVISLPAGLPTAGAVFVLAGALKLLIMCFPYSEMAMMMWLKGRAELGLAGAAKALPLALALAAGAKAIVDRQLHKKRWVQWAIAVGGLVMLWLSRLVFAQPKKSVLDPYFQRVNQERAAAVAEQRRTQAAAGAQRRQHLLPPTDPAVGQQLEDRRQQQQLQQQQQPRLQ